MRRVAHVRVLELNVMIRVLILVIQLIKWGNDVRIEVPTCYSLIFLCFGAYNTRFWMVKNPILC